jgi:hypothetical protein
MAKRPASKIQTEPSHFSNSEMLVAFILMHALTLPLQSHHSSWRNSDARRTCVYSRRVKSCEQFAG